ncbi:MAG: hypothetical protein H6577_22975 [Lewinellaceae bacterium]|nr:hypothetical protein [Saprospiraceae bacterium]MCB9340999.1 hypothetical protein [Lewinellaceae bacterium]
MVKAASLFQEKPMLSTSAKRDGKLGNVSGRVRMVSGGIAAKIKQAGLEKVPEINW